MAKEKKTKLDYAGFFIRLVAVLLDFLVLAIIQRFVRFAFRPPLKGFVSLTVSLGYAPLMLYYYQATLGKMALKLKVVSEDNKKLEVFQVLLREWIGKFLSFLVLFLGFVWIGLDAKKQGWHDKIARTYTIRS